MVTANPTPVRLLIKNFDGEAWEHATIELKAESVSYKNGVFVVELHDNLRFQPKHRKAGPVYG